MIEGILETALYTDDLDAAETFTAAFSALKRFSAPAIGMCSSAAGLASC